MKKKIFTLLAMVMVAMTASAKIGGYALTKAANAHGTTTIKVGDAEATEAEEGATVTVIVTPQEGYIVAAVSGRLYTTWGGAKTRGEGVPVGQMIAATKVKDTENTYTFKMPASNVEVNVTYTEAIKAESKEADNEEKKVEGVTVTVTPSPTEEPKVEDGVLIIPVVVTGSNVPADQNDITVIIPGETVSTDGKTKIVVTNIAADAFATDATTGTRVTTVVLPETEEPIDIADGAMKDDERLINVVTPLSMLDDYALMPALKDNYEASKISATATPKNKYWTFSSGVDCTLPDGVSAYIATYESGQIRIVALDEANTSKVIKANNGVLLACTNDKGGDNYTFTANPGNQASGATIAKTDANSYEGNCLVPVIEGMHFDGNYMILMGNQFFNINPNIDTKVPPCKAVLSKAKGK
jgi:hypothetical protein